MDVKIDIQLKTRFTELKVLAARARIETGLYRHPWDDILYASPKKEELKEEAKKWGD